MWDRSEPGGRPPQASTEQGPGLTSAILDAARQNDRAAITAIYTEYAGPLTRYFVTNTRDRHTAEDLVSKVWVAAIKSLPTFRGPVEALGGWLFRIARHDLLDWRRSQARHRTEPLDDRLEEVTRAEVVHDPQELAANRVDSDRALALLRQLSADQREVLIMRLVSGLSTVEVAKAMGKTVGAVKALQHRALASIQRLTEAQAAAAAELAHVRNNGSMPNTDSQEHPYPSGTHRRLAGEETER